MDNEETKVCQNCKREIPVVNYTIHTVHCARNIKICPVCKEPVPQTELVEHHERMHKLLPCKECGESVCGTDLTDHIRDSCAQTMKTCRFCALELRRGAMPAHERYCGARTERCADCGEWVMLRYRQLHLDSNHGFIRLTDDPEPTTSDVNTSPKLLKPPNIVTVNGVTMVDGAKHSPRATGALANLIQAAPAMVQNPRSNTGNITNSEIQNAIIRATNIIKPIDNPQNVPKNINVPRESEEQIIRSIITNASNIKKASKDSNSVNDTKKDSRKNIIKPRSSGSDGASSSSSANGAIPRSKRSNDQPQLNTAAAAPDKVKKDMWSSGGAVKKRPAPRPPVRPEPPVDPRRDLAFYSALQRQQSEERQRQEQTARNLAAGLPPVLSPAAKIEKLRKMDALQNRESVDQDYKNCLQGRVWMSTDVPAGHVLGSRETRDMPLERQREMQDIDERQREDLRPEPPVDPRRDLAFYSALQRQQSEERQRQEQTARNLAAGLPPVLSPAAKIEKLRKMDALQNRESVDQDYKNCLQGRVWMSTDVPAGHVLGSRETRDMPLERQREMQDIDERQREDLRNLKPMSPEEFMNRFNELQLRKDTREDTARNGDRFSQIKSSLRELRRGLNEVTAPYNINTANEINYWPRPQPLVLPEVKAEAEAEDVALPCEFCDAPVPLHDLVRHQTGCRPDLAQLLPKPNDNHRGASPRIPRASDPRAADPRAADPRAADPRAAGPRYVWEEAAPPRAEYAEPVIPCEFCTESLPVYLINEHQERCGRESNLLFAD